MKHNIVPYTIFNHLFGLVNADLNPMTLIDMFQSLVPLVEYHIILYYF
jgi:hypothetical protein